MSAAIVWTILGVFALGVEAMHLGLIFLFVGVAAIIAGILSALGIPLAGQLIGFAISAVVLAAALRPRLLKKLHGSKGVLSRTDALIGQTGTVTSTIDPISASGRILVGGHDWAAGSTERIESGSLVEVLGSDGIILLVAPVQQISSHTTGYHMTEL
ncbi:MAG: NfeD family protein [Gemmatimonadota bacterium]|nr:NfeD family protein [Gemmatimonadota bacterium]